MKQKEKIKVHITEEIVFCDLLLPDSDPKHFEDMVPNLRKKWDNQDFSQKIFFRMDATFEKSGRFQYIKAIKPK